MKNYFIANGEDSEHQYDIKEMESRVQATLDENTSGMAHSESRKSARKKSECSLSETSTMIRRTNLFDADHGLDNRSGNRSIPATTSRRIPDDLSLEFCREEFLHGCNGFHQVL